MFLVSAELGHVDGVLHLDALGDGRLLVLLATSHLFDDTSLLCFSLELLENPLNVLTFLYRYDNHVFFDFKFLMKHSILLGTIPTVGKITDILQIHQDFPQKCFFFSAVAVVFKGETNSQKAIF